MENEIGNLTMKNIENAKPKGTHRRPENTVPDGVRRCMIRQQDIYFNLYN